MQQKGIQMLDAKPREAVVDRLCQVCWSKTLMKTEVLEPLFDKLIQGVERTWKVRESIACLGSNREGLALSPQDLAKQSLAVT